MAELTTKARDKLPAGKFAGPRESYPVPDKAHASNAKARATQAANAGRMSRSEESKIDARANRVLGKHETHRDQSRPHRQGWGSAK
jgi:hypothetical protein